MNTSVELEDYCPRCDKWMPHFWRYWANSVEWICASCGRVNDVDYDIANAEAAEAAKEEEE